MKIPRRSNNLCTNELDIRSEEAHAVCRMGKVNGFETHDTVVVGLLRGINIRINDCLLKNRENPNVVQP